ncbi:Uncharacterized protein SCF082_LOCUS41032, partial [Durusdinium trenchii]
MDELDLLPAVDALSSSDSAGSGIESEEAVKAKARPAKKNKKRKQKVLEDSAPETELQRALSKSCPCKKNCYEPFRSGPKLTELLNLRRDWGGLHKIDQDKVVFDRIREQKNSSQREWSLLGETICLKGWKRLHGIGSRRFSRMAKAISEGQAAPPVDLRYLNRRCCETELNSGRADVVSFLSDVYASVAETLPDFRDDTYDCETTLEPATDAHGKDPYAELVAKSDPDAAGSSQGPLIGKAPKDKKKKQTRRSVQTNPGREPGSGELCERR